MTYNSIPTLSVEPFAGHYRIVINDDNDRPILFEAPLSLEIMEDIANALESRIKSIYNAGYHDGYYDGWSECYIKKI